MLQDEDYKPIGNNVVSVFKAGVHIAKFKCTDLLQHGFTGWKEL